MNTPASKSEIACHRHTEHQHWCVWCREATYKASIVSIATLQKEVESLRGEVEIANRIIRDSADAAKIYEALKKAKALALSVKNESPESLDQITAFMEKRYAAIEALLDAIKECGL